MQRRGRSSLPGVMPMDPAFYEDLTGRHYGLLIVLADRLNCEDAPVIHQFAGARHCALGLEDIARAPAHRGIGITAREQVLARANQAPPTSELVRELAAHG
jgi:hypothetical protein